MKTVDYSEEQLDAIARWQEGHSEARIHRAGIKYNPETGLVSLPFPNTGGTENGSYEGFIRIDRVLAKSIIDFYGLGEKPAPEQLEESEGIVDIFSYHIVTMFGIKIHNVDILYDKSPKTLEIVLPNIEEIIQKNAARAQIYVMHPNVQQFSPSNPIGYAELLTDEDGIIRDAAVGPYLESDEENSLSVNQFLHREAGLRRKSQQYVCSLVGRGQLKISNHEPLPPMEFLEATPASVLSELVQTSRENPYSTFTVELGERMEGSRSEHFIENFNLI